MFFLGIIVFIVLEALYFVYHFYSKRKLENETFSNWEIGGGNHFSVDELSFIKKQAKLHYGDFRIDDITWNDLAMDDVYQQMNRCLSSSGDEALYASLRQPHTDIEKTERRNALQAWLCSHEQERYQLRSILYRIGGQQKVAIDALYKRGQSDLSVAYGMLMMLSISFVVLLLGCLYMLIASVLYPMILMLTFIVGIANAFLTSQIDKKKADIFLSTLYLHRYVKAIHSFEQLQLDPIWEEHTGLHECAKQLKGLQHSLFQDMYSSDGLIILLAANLGLGEVLAYHRLYTKMLAKREDVLQAIRICGEIDTLLAVSTYRLQQTNLCDAKFVKEMKLQAKGMVHPLLENSVANDVDVLRHVLISGSNASGKSTYLKMIAINTIFAQSFGFALANTYEAGIFRVMTSMSLKDSIEKKDSYFVAEIRSIKRILDALDEKTPILCMIDEILRGTNTGERIAAASEILMSFAKTPSLCLAATHDVELTRILSNHYQNKHFNEQIQDEDMHFDYHLYDGPSHSHNALKLLQTVGFAKETLDAAQIMLQDYEKQGHWTMLKEVKRNEN